MTGLKLEVVGAGVPMGFMVVIDDDIGPAREVARLGEEPGFWGTDNAALVESSSVPVMGNASGRMFSKSD